MLLYKEKGQPFSTNKGPQYFDEYSDVTLFLPGKKTIKKLITNKTDVQMFEYCINKNYDYLVGRL